MSQQRSLETLEVMLAELGRQLTDVRAAQVEMSRSLQIMVRLDAEHANTAKALGRAFDSIKEMDLRIDAIDAQVPDGLSARLLKLEEHAPINSMTSGWVVKAAFLVVVAVAAFVWGRATELQQEIKPPAYPAASYPPYPPKP